MSPSESIALERAAAHRRNPELERVLERLNRALVPAGDVLIEGHAAPELPVLLLVGCPRSGTTLLMQWLAASGEFSVPTNLISRFFGAPAVGALVQRLLFDPTLDFRGEIGHAAAGAPRPAGAPFESSLGKTRGPLEPNEFWYFWRRFFPVGERACLDGSELARVDGRRLARELAAWEAVGQRPLALKALLLDWHLPFLAELLPGAVFVDVVREPWFNVQSLLQARREYSGDERIWYSLKPPEYERLRALDPLRQVAGQVASVRRAVEQGLRSIPAERQLRVSYEEFCARPALTWAQLRDTLGRLGRALPAEAPGPPAFEARNRVGLDPSREARLREAWREAERA